MNEKKQDCIILRETRYPYIKKVILRLNDKKREIGKLDSAGAGTFSTHRGAKHLFRKTNSLGVSLALLSNNNIKFNRIVIEFRPNHKRLETTRDFFLAKGCVFTFKNFETQIFLPLELFGINIAREFEKQNSLTHQTSLFEAE